MHVAGVTYRLFMGMLNALFATQQARQAVDQSGAQGTEGEPEDENTKQAAGQQVARSLGRPTVPAPPDAAVNFAPAVGETPSAMSPQVHLCPHAVDIHNT